MLSVIRFSSVFYTSSHMMFSTSFVCYKLLIICFLSLSGNLINRFQCLHVCYTPMWLNAISKLYCIQLSYFSSNLHLQLQLQLQLQLLYSTVFSFNICYYNYELCFAETTSYKFTIVIFGIVNHRNQSSVITLNCD